MKLIPLTQGKFAQVDDDDYEELSKHKWHVMTGKYTCYAVRKVYLGGGRKNPKYTTVWMHRQILNVEDKLALVDHKDHDGLNNQKNNIRKCTRSQNQRNKRSEINSTSKYLGVDYDSKRNRWKSRIRSNGKEKHLGRFINEIDAAKAYDIAAAEIHGEFANLNFK